MVMNDGVPQAERRPWRRQAGRQCLSGAVGKVCGYLRWGGGQSKRGIFSVLDHSIYSIRPPTHLRTNPRPSKGYSCLNTPSSGRFAIV